MLIEVYSVDSRPGDEVAIADSADDGGWARAEEAGVKVAGEIFLAFVLLDDDVEVVGPR